MFNLLIYKKIYHNNLELKEIYTYNFNAGVKEKNTKTNKITIVENQKLATQNFLFNMHINVPFGNI